LVLCAEQGVEEPALKTYPFSQGRFKGTINPFLGRHHGKIVEMTDTYVAVVEIVSDGTKDGWVERPRTIKLSGV
jgi:type IV pilus assembly protein PilP